MRVFARALKKGIIKLQIDTDDDLWYLKNIIEPRDLVKARTMRSQFLFREGKKEKVGRKPMVLEIEVEKIEFQRHVFRLRLTGKIVIGPEETELASYHTLEIKVGSKIAITKSTWPKYLLQKLKKAETRVPNVLIAVMDYDEVTFGMLKRGTLDVISEFSNPHSIQEEDKLIEYYKKIATEIEKLSENVQNVIIAGPGFVKEHVVDILKERNPELFKKIKTDSTTSATKSGLLEILRRGMLEKIIKDSEIVKESRLIEEFFTHLKKEDGLVVYKLEDVRTAEESGAIGKLLIIEEKIRDKSIEQIAKSTESKGGEVFIISPEHNLGEQFQRFGGLGAILRFKLFY